MNGTVVAIDGPAAAGKSTTARRVARALGFAHLNSGVVYRALTWVTIERGWDETTADYPERIRGLALELRPASDGFVVHVDGEEPGPELHGRAVSGRVSAVSAVPVVREVTLGHLRAAAETRNVVCDGRDIGTEVFPGADLKLFLVADADERARRRLLDLGEEPSPERVRAEARRLRARDRADSTREASPLRRASDALLVDTSDRSPEEVVDEILRLCRERGIGRPEA